MTSNLLENVKVYLLSQVLTRYCIINFGNSWKLDFFRINRILKKSDVENLKNLFSFRELLLYLSETRIKTSGHRTNSLSGGPNLTLPQ